MILMLCRGTLFFLFFSSLPFLCILFIPFDPFIPCIIPPFLFFAGNMKIIPFHVLEGNVKDCAPFCPSFLLLLAFFLPFSVFVGKCHSCHSFYSFHSSYALFLFLSFFARNQMPLSFFIPFRDGGHHGIRAFPRILRFFCDRGTGNN